MQEVSLASGEGVGLLVFSAVHHHRGCVSDGDAVGDGVRRARGTREKAVEG